MAACCRVTAWSNRSRTSVEERSFDGVSAPQVQQQHPPHRHQEAGTSLKGTVFHQRAAEGQEVSRRRTDGEGAELHLCRPRHKTTKSALHSKTAGGVMATRAGPDEQVVTQLSIDWCKLGLRHHGNQIKEHKCVIDRNAGLKGGATRCEETKSLLKII